MSVLCICVCERSKSFHYIATMSQCNCLALLRVIILLEEPKFVGSHSLLQMGISLENPTLPPSFVAFTSENEFYY